MKIFLKIILKLISIGFVFAVTMGIGLAFYALPDAAIARARDLVVIENLRRSAPAVKVTVE